MMDVSNGAAGSSSPRLNLDAKGTYFDVYGAGSAAGRPSNLDRRLAKARSATDGTLTPPPRHRLKATRQASVRHSRAASDAAQSPPTDKDLYPSLSIDPLSISVESMDGLVDTLPRSPGRRSRPRVRTGATALQRDRRDADLERQARELKARLESLSEREPAFKLPAWQPSSSTSPASSASPMGSRTSTLYVPAEEDNAAEEIRGKILSIDEIVKRHHPPSNGTHSAPTVPTISRIPSIDELVSAHRARVSDASPKHSWSLPTSRASNGMKGRASAPPMVESPDDMQELDETSPRSSLDSLDAISAETTHCLSIHSPQIGPRSTSGAFFDTPPSSVDPSNDAESVQRKPIVPPPSLQSEHDRKIAEYLRSRRLTRLVTVSAPTGKLTVSLADVGAPTGHPVIVFLGLGCVRYLVALYDELAEIMGLRLICIDRWGLGRTDDIPERKRGFLEWSSVVEQVADQLQLPTFSVVAHSAGAPYALATSLKLSLRITGSLHLLAPWVNASVEGQAATYKWLKYVPKTVIQTAQAAEWKLTAWKLGKPPELAYAPVGNDPRAPVSFLSYRSDAPPVLVTSPSTDLAGEVESDDGHSVRSAATEGKRTPTRQHYRSPTANSLTTPTRSRLSLSRRSSYAEAPAAPVHSLRSTAVKSPAASTHSLPASPTSNPSSADIATALLKASHAESLKGSTADLMVILERTGKSSGFRYADVSTPCKIWHGDKDERISLASVRGLALALPSCTLEVVAGDHALMTDGAVVYACLESIKQEVSLAPR